MRPSTAPLVDSELALFDDEDLLEVAAAELAVDVAVVFLLAVALVVAVAAADVVAAAELVAALDASPLAVSIATVEADMYDGWAVNCDASVRAPVPHAIVEPSMTVLLGGSTVVPVLSVMVKRPVHVTLEEAEEVNW